MTTPGEGSGEDKPAPVSSQEEQTRLAQKLSRQTRSTRNTVDHDEPGDGGRDDGPGGLPGLDAFHSISGIAPFLALVRLYAESLYPRRKSPRSRFDAFAVDHKWLVRGAFVLDVLLRLALVLLILALVLKGISPLEWPWSDAPADAVTPN